MDLVRAAGLRDDGKPLIDDSRVSQWLRGQRPSWRLAVAAAQAFGAPEGDALRAAGYEVGGALPAFEQQATGSVTPPAEDRGYVSRVDALRDASNDELLAELARRVGEDE